MKKVLVIEDNETNLYLMRTILKKYGCHVIEAQDGYSGVELAVAESPDLILMDIQLPILDGYGATKKIRSIEKTKNIPIIAITSYAMVGDKEKTLRAGCNVYIEKPIDPKSFIEELKKFL
ncbi:Chemotaxis protein CheY [Candidatus Lokiarchaeum ossiferum]|uniref:Chemotaxis protein CheY n=1 Tax=Candidatus Lokiarchaeum ossiferum TaxID=2951803 RepID=A0ABY6HV44_9ARCH|nr:Chemotaxis protein CheY [Candidatus Lokiarchaeum sp. B-35]